jgi:hypothetical protein
MKVKKVLHQKTLTFKEGENMGDAMNQIDDFIWVYKDEINSGPDIYYQLSNPISIIIKVYEQEET